MKLALAGMGDYEYKDGKYTLKDDKPSPFECVVCLYDAATGHELRRLEGQECRCGALPSRRMAGTSSPAASTGPSACGCWPAGTSCTTSSCRASRASPAWPFRPTVSTCSRGTTPPSCDYGLSTPWSWSRSKAGGRGPARRGLLARQSSRLSGGDDYLVRLWDADTLTELSHYPGHTTRVTGVAFLPDGQHAISASMDGRCGSGDCDGSSLAASRSRGMGCGVNRRRRRAASGNYPSRPTCSPLAGDHGTIGALLASCASAGTYPTPSGGPTA